MLFKRIALRVCLFLYLGCAYSFVFADTVVLKTGQVVEGKITENTGKYVKINFDGVELTYFQEEVASINQDRANNAANKELISLYESFKSGKKVLEDKNLPIVPVESAQPIVNSKAQDAVNADPIPPAEIAGGANLPATVQAAISQLPKGYQDMVKSRLQNLQDSDNIGRTSGVPPEDLSGLPPEYQKMIKSSLEKMQPNAQETKN